MNQPVLIWGHRGCRQNSYHYENSLSSFQYAFEHGEGLETDAVRAGSDIFLIHDTIFIEQVDYELARHMDEKSQKLLAEQQQQPPYLYKLTDNVASQLHLKDGTLIPRLTEMLQLLSKYPHHTLNLELKGPSVWQPALAIIEKAVTDGMITRDQIVFSSFAHPPLMELRQKVGTLYKIGCLFAKETQTLTPTFSNWPDLSDADKAGHYIPFSKEALENDVLKAIQPDYFNIENSVARMENLDLIAAKFPAAKIIMWALGAVGEENPLTNNSVTNKVQELYPTGKIHAVITDFPVEMKSVFKKHSIPVI
ncbi:MAG TPA: hypothetical protein VGF14_06065 [Alphaproteobacteria bacterium]